MQPVLSVNCFPAHIAIAALAPIPELPRPYDAIVPELGFLERAKGFEPSTSTLARSRSTTELHPHPKALAANRRQRGDLCQMRAAECNSSCDARNPDNIFRFRLDRRKRPSQRFPGVGTNLAHFAAFERPGPRITMISHSVRRQRPPQRFEPSAEPAAQGGGIGSRAGRIAIESRPPFDERRRRHRPPASPARSPGNRSSAATAGRRRRRFATARRRTAPTAAGGYGGPDSSRC